MYYKRLFTGSTGASTKRILYYMGLDGNPYTSGGYYTNSFRQQVCNVMGKAVEQTLKDCGFTNAHYDEANAYLYLRHGIDKSGFIIYNQNDSGIHFCIAKDCEGLYYADPLQVTTSSNATGWGSYANGYIPAQHIVGSSSFTDASQNYRFKVIIKGNPKTFFRIYLSSYSNDNAEYGMIGIGFFNLGESVNSVIGFTMHETTYTSLPYWILLRASDLVYLMDGQAHTASFTTSNMVRPLQISYYPNTGLNTGSILNVNLGLHPLFFDKAAGISNPKIYFSPHGYVNGVNSELSSGYSRFFESGDRQFYQENTICVEV